MLPRGGSVVRQRQCTQDYDRQVQVVMLLGEEDAAPTIDVIDNGIGIAPKDFASTILSLQGSNKLKKPYLVGAFGQGGSSTIRFCDYTIIVSRRFDSPPTVGFTVIRKMILPEPYKYDAYVYLALKNEEGRLAVPSLITTARIDYYPTFKSHPVMPFDSGTLVRHVGYELDSLHNTLNPAPGNLYHLFQQMMFDPLLPFRVIDLRKPAAFGAFRNELITGSRNRLMKYTLEIGATEKQTEEQEPEESGTELRHSMPREMVSPRSDADPQIGIEYWVALNREKKKDGTLKLRARSHALYVDPQHPIIGTLHCQNQGTDTEQILKEMQLPQVAKHIVIHIDATQASKDIRNQLFTSTRETFAEGEVLNEIKRVLTKMLKEDEVLYEIEGELEESLIEKGTADVDQEVKKEISSLLRDAGFKVKDPGETVTAGNGDETYIAPIRHRRHHHIKPEPLPTLPYPQVTRFEIVYPKDKLSVHQRDNHVVRIETDADFRFGREGKLGIRAEPPKLEIASTGMLQGGRMYWRLRPTEDSKAGDTGEIIATIFKPDGSFLIAKVPYEILPAREEKGTKAKGLVPPFDIYPVDPYEERDRFDKIWDDLEPEDDITAVAYRTVPSGGTVNVYYSTAFAPYKNQLERLKQQAKLDALFRKYYKIWIGYHAILQHQERSHLAQLAGVPDEQLNKVQERERAIVAEMQVKQALQMAEMQSKVLTQSSAD